MDRRANADSLVIVEAPSEDDLGRRFFIRQDLTTIGRDPDNLIVANDDRVSPHHVSIRRSASSDANYVVDVHSADGAFVNKAPVAQRCELRRHDQLKIGDTVLELVSGCDSEHQYHEICFRFETTDPVTELLKKRLLRSLLVKEIALSVRRRTPLSMAMIDVDQLAAITMQYGRPTSDALLRAVAAILIESARVDDELARYRNDELCVVYVETGLEAATTLSEALRARIEERVFTIDGHAFRVTVSIGLAEAKPGMDVDAFYAAVSETLVRAQRAGGNRIAR